ncbi:MAG: PQQ-binding-like beta-propeller repeat protein [Spirochaetes bacterium]|nr:PQQ-binding-like beta-propeller repeat protein [Spirochaetota bacterium]
MTPPRTQTPPPPFPWLSAKGKGAGGIGFLLLLLSLLPAADWPSWRGNPQQTGLAQGKLSDNLKRIWSFKTGKKTVSTPVVSGGVAYFGSGDRNVWAIALATGKPLWSFATSNAVDAPGLLVGETLFIGGSDGNFFALDAKKGTLRWKSLLDGQIMGAPGLLVRGNSPLILFGAYDNALHAYDPSGKKKWSFPVDNYINGAPAVDGNRIAFGGCDGFLRVLSEDGKALASVDAGAYLPASPALSEGFAYFGNHAGKLLAVNLAKGQIVWQVGDEDAGPFFSSPAVGAASVLAGSRDNRLHCLNRASGKKKWVFLARGGIDSSPVLVSDRVVFGSMDGSVYSLRLTDGSVAWSYDTGARITGSPAVVDGLLLIAAEDGTLYAFGGPK